MFRCWKGKSCPNFSVCVEVTSVGISHYRLVVLNLFMEKNNGLEKIEKVAPWKLNQVD